MSIEAENECIMEYEKEKEGPSCERFPGSSWAFPSASVRADILSTPRLAYPWTRDQRNRKEKSSSNLVQAGKEGVVMRLVALVESHGLRSLDVKVHRLIT